MLRRRGLTLVELLAVIAIIGLLVALLFPAVQAAREAARRTQCMNNVKQVATALTLFHFSMNAFPMGNVESSDGNGTHLGNWRGSVLPYLEQTSVSDRLRAVSPTVASGWSSKRNDGDFGTGIYGTGAYRVLAGLRVSTFVCPSNNTDPNFNALNPIMNNAERGQTHSYVGISGACPDPEGRPGKCTDDMKFSWGAANGMLSKSGLLVPTGVVRLDQARDGASTTLLIGEQSGLIGGQPITANYHGGWAGHYRGSGGKKDVFGDADQFGTGLTTLRYAINLQTSIPPAGANYPFAQNTILGSFHPGGAFGGFADGSVRWLADDIALPELLKLGTRDDGQPSIEF
ncbi:MAG: Type secretion system protein precursor [Planctomycetota bacterium]